MDVTFIFTSFIFAGIVLPTVGQQPFQALLVGVDHRTNVTSNTGKRIEKKIIGNICDIVVIYS